MKIGLSILSIWLVGVMSAFGDRAIEDVQRVLKEQGFYYGEITGEKDADTTAAIRRFQIRNGLQITGELNDETLKSLKAGASSSSVTKHTPSPAPATPDLRDDSNREEETDAAPAPRF